MKRLICCTLFFLFILVGISFAADFSGSYPFTVSIGAGDLFGGTWHEIPVMKGTLTITGTNWTVGSRSGTLKVYSGTFLGTVIDLYDSTGKMLGGILVDGGQGWITDTGHSYGLIVIGIPVPKALPGAVAAPGTF